MQMHLVKIAKPMSLIKISLHQLI